MRVLIIEDEPKIRQYLKRGLAEHGFAIVEAEDGETGLHLACSEEYDVVILDVMLPSRDGWSVARELRQRGKTTPVLFLTARDAVRDRVKGLELGGDDYLVKPFAFSELLARVRSLLRRPALNPAEKLCVDNLEIDLLRHKASRDGRVLDLTTKEFSLLTLLAHRTGEVISRTLIAEQVWDVNFDGDTNVIDVAVGRLRRKVDDSFGIKLIHTVRGSAMSSKNVNSSSPSPKPAHGKWPISRVLTIHYTLSACIILFLASAFLYYVMDSSSEAEDRQSLADQMEILRLTLRETPDDPEALRREIQTEGAARRFAKYYARVLTAEGRVVIQTGDMERLLPAGAFPPPVEVSKVPREGRLWKTPKQARPQKSSEGNYFLLMSGWAEVGAPPKDTRLLQLALDVTQDEAVLARYRRMLVLVLGIGICCSAAAGMLIVRKGMRPLQEITRAARRITVAQLHERIDPAQWPQDLAELATAFDEMLARLEASFKRLSQFSADLAHEFRTPMTSLRTQAEWALMRNRSPDECRRVLEASLEEYERLSRMVDSLLFLARAENAEMIVQRAPFSAANETQAVIDLFNAAVAEKGVVLEIQGDACLQGDAGLFRRALSNLLDNSFRHTPAGGRITISTRQFERDGAEVRVEDTGCGVAAEHLPKLFDRFYRVDSSRHQPGAGLGLSLVKSIIELHKGSVSLQSEPGRGTSVVMTFPAEPSAPTPA